MNLIIKNITNKGTFETILNEVKSFSFTENSVITKHNLGEEKETLIRANDGKDNWDWEKIIIEIERISLKFK